MGCADYLVVAAGSGWCRPTHPQKHIFCPHILTEHNFISVGVKHPIHNAYEGWVLVMRTQAGVVGHRTGTGAEQTPLPPSKYHPLLMPQSWPH